MTDRLQRWIWRAGAAGVLLLPVLAMAQFAPAPGGAFATDRSHTSIAVADFNGDGRADIATTSNNLKLSVFLSNSSGGFTEVIGISTSVLLRQVVTGDFNGDGRPDLAATTGTGVAVWLGNGAGAFSTAAGSPYALPALSLVVGDFNRDGRLDIAGANVNSITMLLGSGSGSFTKLSPTAFTGSSTFNFSLVTADFNGDGKPDLAISQGSPASTLTILLGDSAGGFSQAAGSPINSLSSAYSMVAGDFNSDGKQDLITSDNYNLNLHRGNGAGGFTVQRQAWNAFLFPYIAAVGDVNADGRPDLIITNIEASGSGSSYQTSVAYGDASGRFTEAPGGPFLTGFSSHIAAVGDFNGDGKPDVVIAPSVGLFVLLNTSPLRPADCPSGTCGSLTTNPASVTFYGKTQPIPVRVTSATGGSTYTAAPNSPWLSVTPTNSATGGTTTVTLARASAGGGVYAYNVGKAGITAPNFIGAVTKVIYHVPLSAERLVPDPANTFAAGVTPNAVAVWNYDQSPRSLIAVVNGGSNNVTLRGFSGGRVTTFGGPYSVGQGPRGVILDDLDDDGSPDLVTANAGSNDVSVLMKLGSGRAAVSYPAGSQPVAVASADVNQDGFPDLVVANAGSANITVLLGDGAGGFSAASGRPFAAGNSPAAVVVSDFDGDGKPDIAISNASTNTVTVLIGNGLGSFVAAVGSPFAVGPSPLAILAEDLNGDGFVDLATANADGNNVTVLLGNGTGGFSAAGGSPFAVGSSPRGLVVADFDGDGWPDLATASFSGNSITVLLGNGTGSFAASPCGPFVTGSNPVALAPVGLASGYQTGLIVVSAGDGMVTTLAAETLSTSPVLSTTVGPAVGQGTPVPLTISLGKSGAFRPPTGTVELYDYFLPVDGFCDNGGTSTLDCDPILLGTINFAGGLTFITTNWAQGEHSINAHYSGDGRYPASDSNWISLTVNSASPATVTLGSLTANYDGSPKNATATTVPAGLPVTFTYNGSPTAPTAVGSYTVVGSINSPTYTGSASGTLVISKGLATVTLSGLSATYTGSPVLVGVATSPAGLTTTVTYNGSSVAPTAPGSYSVVATVVSANYSGTVSGTLVISGGLTTLQTNVPGLPISVDGAAAQPSPISVVLAAGTHTISVPSVVAGATGTRHVFSGWSDGGAATHSITAGAGTTYAASFDTQHLLTTTAAPGGTVSAGGYFNAGTTATVTAMPSAGFTFAGFTGSTASLSNPLVLLIDAPKSLAAGFTGPPLLTAAITSKAAGVGDERIWTVQVTNNGAGSALNARIGSVQIVAVNPLGNTSLILPGSTVYPAPVSNPTLAPGQSSTVPIRIVFPATTPATRIQFRINLVADNGYTNSVTLSNVVR